MPGGYALCCNTAIVYATSTCWGYGDWLRLWIRNFRCWNTYLSGIFLLTGTTGEDLNSLPQLLKAPNLHHLVLSPFIFPHVAPFLSTTAYLITLSLGIVSYFDPNDLLKRLAHLPQLETLRIAFLSPVPNHGAQERLLYTLSITEVTIPKLRCFWFKGTSAYLEALLPGMNTPWGTQHVYQCTPSCRLPCVPSSSGWLSSDEYYHAPVSYVQIIAFSHYCCEPLSPISILPPWQGLSITYTISGKHPLQTIHTAHL